PTDVGIYCTGLKSTPELIQGFEWVMDGNKRPFLVLHPNGGWGFDLSTQTFQDREESDRWAEDLAILVNEAKGRG
ncbi:uncharacterized protein EDB91DRAFT_1012569, partial [Suillus paluster]|uniref:uncharacterized protein n=1 Tax=Suillus paluster TaxID=48578 RepID=UPI001B8659B1